MILSIFKKDEIIADPENVLKSIFEGEIINNGGQWLPDQ